MGWAEDILVLLYCDFIGLGLVFKPGNMEAIWLIIFINMLKYNFSKLGESIHIHKDKYYHCS